jgi:ABC-type taurine transport system substrate-binding protein
MGKPFTVAPGIQCAISIPPAIEKHAVKFDLGRPYRCTPGIQALADAYLGKNSGRNIMYRKELGGCEVARAVGSKTVRKAARMSMNIRAG